MPKAYRGDAIPKKVPAGTYVTNISSINNYLLCSMKWNYSQVLGRIPARIEKDFLAIGTAGHLAVERLHAIMGEWDPNAALGIAQLTVNEVAEELKKKGQFMTEKERDTRQWFIDWFPRAFSQYAFKHKSVPWTEVISVEEAVALYYTVEELLEEEDRGRVLAGRMLQTAGYSGLMLIGTPDCYAVIRDKVWHVQRKFFSSRTDLLEFAATGPFQKHEVFYPEAAHWLHTQGDFKFPAGSTLFDLIRKMDAPGPVEDLTSPKVCKCFMQDEYDHFTFYLANHPVNAKKTNAKDLFVEHRKIDVDKLVNFKEKVARRKHECANYAERAFVREESILKRKKRQEEMTEILYAVGLMGATERGDLLPVKSQGPACDAYFSPCPYKGVCAGSNSLSGAQFKNRGASYTDIPEEK